MNERDRFLKYCPCCGGDCIYEDSGMCVLCTFGEAFQGMDARMYVTAKTSQAGRVVRHCKPSCRMINRKERRRLEALYGKEEETRAPDR